MMTEKEINTVVNKLLGLPVIVLRINYKSGNYIVCCFHEFEVKDGEWKWNACNQIIQRKVIGEVQNAVYTPVLINIDEIESMWQIQTYTKVSEIFTAQDLIDYFK